jgi:hypothetical protein
MCHNHAVSHYHHCHNLFVRVHPHSTKGDPRQWIAKARLVDGHLTVWMQSSLDNNMHILEGKVCSILRNASLGESFHSSVLSLPLLFRYTHLINVTLLKVQSYWVKYHCKILFTYCSEKSFIASYCKVLMNKDHTKCGKEWFIGTRLQGCHSFWVQSEEAWLKWVVGFIGGAKPWGEGDSLWSPIICDHQMEQVDMPG